MKIWRDYDQTQLDAQYQTRTQIGDQYESWTQARIEDSQNTRATIPNILDIPYGSHPRQKLDLFFPNGRDRKAPLGVFIHGGFWRARDKSDYSYVAKGLAALGGSVALINYPLCPQASLHEIVVSARGAIRWLIDHADEYGIDAKNIYVTGHSAGAHLAAMCFSGDGSDASELPVGAISGALLSSGLYELEPTRLCFANADIRLDEEQVKKLSPMRLKPVALAGHVAIAYGTAETEEFAWQANGLAKTLRARGATADVIAVPGANHYTIVPQLERAGTQLMDALLAAAA